MAKRDYYDVLGVQKGADEAALKGAYRMPIAVAYLIAGGPTAFGAP